MKKQFEQNPRNLRNPRNHSGEKGLTLVEMVLAAIILVVALLGVIGLVGEVQKQTNETEMADEISLLMAAAEKYAYAHWDFLKRSETQFAGTNGSEYENDAAMLYFAGDNVSGTLVKRLRPELLEDFLPFNHGIDMTDCETFDDEYESASSGSSFMNDACSDAGPEECLIFVAPYKEYFYQIYLVGPRKPSPYKTASQEAREAYDNNFYIAVQVIRPDYDPGYSIFDFFSFAQPDTPLSLSNEEVESVEEMMRIIRRVNRGWRAVFGDAATPGDAVTAYKTLAAKKENPGWSPQERIEIWALLEASRTLPYPCLAVSYSFTEYPPSPAPVAWAEWRIDLVRRRIENSWDRTIRADLEEIVTPPPSP